MALASHLGTGVTTLPPRGQRMCWGFVLTPPRCGGQPWGQSGDTELPREPWEAEGAPFTLQVRKRLGRSRSTRTPLNMSVCWGQGRPRARACRRWGLGSPRSESLPEEGSARFQVTQARCPETKVWVLAGDTWEENMTSLTCS